MPVLRTISFRRLAKVSLANLYTCTPVTESHFGNLAGKSSNVEPWPHTISTRNRSRRKIPFPCPQLRFGFRPAADESKVKLAMLCRVRLHIPNNLFCSKKSIEQLHMAHLGAFVERVTRTGVGWQADWVLERRGHPFQGSSTGNHHWPTRIDRR